MAMYHQPDPYWMTVGDQDYAPLISDCNPGWEDEGLYEPDEEECQ